MDLGDPTDYLYTELIFDKDPFFIRIIPLVSIDKERIQATLRKPMADLAREYCGFMTDDFFRVGLNFFSENSQNLVVRDGILFSFKSYRDSYNYVTEIRGGDEIEEYSLEEVINQAELYRTFTDYRIVQTADREKSFLPYSVICKIFNDPPEWAIIDTENIKGFLRFPYITLESLQMTPDLKTLTIDNFWTKEIIGTEALNFCHSLEEISIFDEGQILKKFDFPKRLLLPNLKILEIIGTSLKYLQLTFLQDSPNLQSINVVQNLLVKEIVFPLLEKHALLEEIQLSNNHLESFVLPDLLNCPNLKELAVSRNHLQQLNLTPLRSCVNLQKLNLSANQIKNLDLSPLQHCLNLNEFFINNNRIETLDLTPLQHCNHLRYFDLSRNRIEKLDLSTFQHCSSIKEIALSHNLLKDLDLSPLKVLPNLEKVNLADNHLEVIDLFPVQHCPYLKTIDLQNNPLKNILNQKDLPVLRY